MQKTRKFFSLVMSCLLCLSLIPTRGIAEISSQDSDATMLGADQNDAVGEATVLYRVHRVGEAAWNDDAQGWISQDADILKSHDDTSQRNEAAPLDSLAIMLSGLPGSVAYRLSAETQEGKWAKDGQEAQVQDATKLEVILEGDLSKSHALLYRWHTSAGWSQWEGLPSKAQDSTVDSGESHDVANSEQSLSLEQAADSIDPQPKADASPFIAAKQAKKVTIRDAIFHKIKDFWKRRQNTIPSGRLSFCFAKKIKPMWHIRRF